MVFPFNLRFIHLVWVVWLWVPQWCQYQCLLECDATGERPCVSLWSKLVIVRISITNYPNGIRNFKISIRSFVNAIVSVSIDFFLQNKLCYYGLCCPYYDITYLISQDGNVENDKSYIISHIDWVSPMTAHYRSSWHVRLLYTWHTPLCSLKDLIHHVLYWLSYTDNYDQADIRHYV